MQVSQGVSKRELQEQGGEQEGPSEPLLFTVTSPRGFSVILHLLHSGPQNLPKDFVKRVPQRNKLMEYKRQNTERLTPCRFLTPDVVVRPSGTYMPHITLQRYPPSCPKVQGPLQLSMCGVSPH